MRGVMTHYGSPGLEEDDIRLVDLCVRKSQGLQGHTMQGHTPLMMATMVNKGTHH